MLELKEFVVSANKLFTIPDICLSLNQLVTETNCSVEDISRLVCNDPALSARILKLSNSALYGNSGNIKTVQQAILRIGTDELCNLAMATSAALVFRDAGNNRVDLDQYWQHSVSTAVLARGLYKLGFSKPAGHLFTAGLLHNIGLLVVLERLPYYVINLFDVIGDRKRPAKFEQDSLGFSLSDASSELLSHWNLNQDLVTIIRYQHIAKNNLSIKNESLALYSAIKIADQLSSEISPVKLDGLFNDTQITELNLTQKKLDDLIATAMVNVKAIVSIIQG